MPFTNIDVLVATLPQVPAEDKSKIDACFSQYGSCDTSTLQSFWEEESSAECKAINLLSSKPILKHDTGSLALPSIISVGHLLCANQVKSQGLNKLTGEGAGVNDPRFVSFWDARPHGMHSVSPNTSRSAGNHYQIPISLIICENEYCRYIKKIGNHAYKGVLYNEVIFKDSVPLEFISYIVVPPRYVKEFEQYLKNAGVIGPKIISFGTLHYKKALVLSHFNEILSDFQKAKNKEIFLVKNDGTNIHGSLTEVGYDTNYPFIPYINIIVEDKILKFALDNLKNIFCPAITPDYMLSGKMHQEPKALKAIVKEGLSRFNEDETKQWVMNNIIGSCTDPNTKQYAQQELAALKNSKQVSSSLAKEKDAKKLFLNEYDKVVKYNFYSKSELDRNWSLSEILAQAKVKNKNIRKVCVRLNWLDQKGIILTSAPDIVKKAYEYSLAMPLKSKL